jgi:pSer/pThr/pTyr-binding forkhead associated (FHA) protein
MALLLLIDLLKEKANESGNLVMKDAFLFLSQGPGPSTGYPLLGEETIGSDPDNTIVLPDETVSPSHARVSFQEGAWTVEDLGSDSGIVYKGKRVNKVVLSNEDTFQIGSFTFRFTEADIPDTKDQFFETVTIL